MFTTSAETTELELIVLPYAMSDEDPNEDTDDEEDEDEVDFSEDLDEEEGVELGEEESE